MERDRILRILREHEQELKAAGLVHLRLFGSVARGDETVESDVDLLADYDEAVRLTLFDLLRLQEKLTQLLSAEVHLTSAETLKWVLRPAVMLEAVHAF